MNQNRLSVKTFLQNRVQGVDWYIQATGGTGHESYFADAGDQSLFIKIGANLPLYEKMAAEKLTPAVLIADHLPNGQSILVQSKVKGQTPNRQDFQMHLEKFAAVLNQTHQNTDLKALLPSVKSSQHKDLALNAFEHVIQKWGIYQPQVLNLAEAIDAKLNQLQQEISQIDSEGVVVSHNDICNANWLITAENNVFLIDLDSMTLDDPAFDLGALLWWYYPPEMRGRFLELMGYQNDIQIKKRMQIRMAIHCLNILLPRENSFDQFDPNGFSDHIVDFFAVANGEENPQGYE